MKNQEKPPALTIYYDGSCPLCQREIAFYRRNPASHALAWVDVSQPAVLGAGLDCAQAMARFHVRTADGQLFDGAAAFSQLWRRLPGWRLLGWVLAMPPISWLGEGHPITHKSPASKLQAAWMSTQGDGSGTGR